MTDPKKGYKNGVYRLVSGTVDADGVFSITNIPREGYVPGVYKLEQVTIDANGDTSTAENDIGISRSITVTVDGDGNLSETEIPQEGYVPGVYRVTTSTNYPVEGLVETFTAVDGAITSGVWTSGGWLYRKKLTLTGSADGILTNHQMRVVVHYGSGTDGAPNDEDVYLGSKSRTEFSDIRFTKSDATELD